MNITQKAIEYKDHCTYCGYPKKGKGCSVCKGWPDQNKPTSLEELKKQIRDICTYHGGDGTSGYLLSEIQFGKLFDLFEQAFQDREQVVATITPTFVAVPKSLEELLEMVRKIPQDQILLLGYVDDENIIRKLDLKSIEQAVVKHIYSPLKIYP